MGKNIEQIPNRVTTLTDDALIYGGEASGGTHLDATITKANLLKEDRARILNNENEISAIESSVSSLGNQFAFVRRTGDNASFQVTQEQNSYLFMIGLLKTSTLTNPTVSVGTTLGGDDIVSSREITGSERIIIKGNYELANNTLFFTVSGGQVSTTIVYMKNFFNV